MTERIAIVANPSKLDDPARTRAELESHAARLGCPQVLWYESTPEDPGHGMTVQALADGAELVCALGGDGTVRAVGGALRGTGTPLGLLPAGTGNLLARNLEIPLDDLAEALTIALQGSAEDIDVGLVRRDGGEPEAFLVITGAGLDAEMMDKVDDRLKQRVGWLAYGISGIQVVAERGFKASVDALAGGRWHRVRSVMVCNCGRLQAGVNLVPEAHPADGLLDVLELSPRGLPAWLRTIMDVVLRRRDSDYVRHASTEHVRVQVAKPVIAQLDGDATSPTTTFEAWVEPASLVVKAPRPLEPGPQAR